MIPLLSRDQLSAAAPRLHLHTVPRSVREVSFVHPGHPQRPSPICVCTALLVCVCVLLVCCMQCVTLTVSHCASPSRLPRDTLPHGYARSLAWPHCVCAILRATRLRASVIGHARLWVWLGHVLGRRCAVPQRRREKKAHRQHTYSPISSISQGGILFMQPGHTPLAMANSSSASWQCMHKPW